MQIKESDNIYLVSDISRLMMNAIQHNEKFDPTALIMAFKDYLSKGNLFIPGFVNTLENNATIDMRSLKPETGGLSKEAFVQYKKGACVRTNDPFHSFFIFGKDGEKIANNSFDNSDTFGENSTFSYLHKNDGILIMIDLALYYGFTFCHYVEQKLNVKYRETKPYLFNFTDTRGNSMQKKFHVYAKKRGYNPVLNGLKGPLEQAGALQTIHFNGANISKINLTKAYDVIKNDIENNRAKNLIDFDISLYLKQTIKLITG